MYTVDQMLAPGFRRSWQEAVALVQEVAAEVGPAGTVPAPGDLYLHDTGSLALGNVPPAGEHPVTGLARLLSDALRGIDAPTALRELADDNAGPTPRHASVEGFSRALAFFERPGRSSDLREVAQRLAAAPRAPTDAEVEILKLRERLSIEAQKDQGPVDPAAPRPRPGIFVVVAGVSLLCAGVLAVGPRLQLETATGAITPLRAAKAFAHGRTATPPSAEGKALRGNAVMPGAAERSSKHAPTPGPRHDRNVHAESEPSDARASRNLPLEAGAVMMPIAPDWREPFGPRPLAPAVSDPPRPAPPRSPAPAPRASAAAPTPKHAGPREVEFQASIVYSSADQEVEPAWLMRPQLPKEPPAGTDTGYFDIVVDEAGDVELIKLVSPAHRYQDRMLVAAAKAWKFKPAMLDGQPVKYRLRISIILQDLR